MMALDNIVVLNFLLGQKGDEGRRFYIRPDYFMKSLTQNALKGRRYFTTALILLFILCAAVSAYADGSGKRVRKALVKQEKIPGLQSIGPEGSIQRTVAFTGEPIIIHSRVNRGTLIRMPETPLLIQMGRQEDFSVEVFPEVNYVMIKPTTPMGATDVFITTRKGLYIFFFYAEEEPKNFQAQKADKYDMIVTVTDPYKSNAVDDIQSLVWMLYHGRKMTDMQFMADVMTTPNASIFAQDPVLGVGVAATLMRVHCIPGQNLITYWVRFENVRSAKLNMKSYSQTYALDEKAVWAPGLIKVAVPNIGGRSAPLMTPGDKLDMFLVTKGDKIPPNLRIRFALQGSRTIPMEATFPTRGTGWKVKKPLTGKESDTYKRIVDSMESERGGGSPNPASPNDTGELKNNDFIIDQNNNGRPNSAQPTPNRGSDEIIFETPGVTQPIQKPTTGAPTLYDTTPSAPPSGKNAPRY